MKRSLLLSLAVFPLLANALSINEVVQKTIDTHPQVQMKKENYLAEKELLTRVKAGYLPSVNLSYSVGPEVTKTPANSRQRANLTRQEASVTLTQNVFAGGDTWYGTKQQKALVSSSSDKVQEKANSLALETAKAYIEVLKTYNLLKVAKENVAVHKKYLAQIKKSVNAGVGRNSDYEQTLSRYEDALSTQTLTNQNYINAISSFKRIYPGDVTASDLEEPVIGELPADNMNDLVTMALQNNPTVVVSHDDIKAARAAVKKSNSPFYPTADIKLSSYWDKNVHGLGYNGAQSNDNGYSALLVLNYNIFNGLADSATKQANEHRLLNKNATLADAKRYIQAYTEIAWQTFESTKQQLVYIDKHIKASNKTVADYRKEHNLGRRSIIDLLNIELEYNNARNSKVTAEYDNLSAYYQILSYTGKLVENMNVNAK